MPDNLLKAFAPVLQPAQAGLFLFLLVAVSICDLRLREIPDRLQLAIAALTLLCFSPYNLMGILGALPYMVVALFFQNGVGGGDIKLVAATGAVLGLSASLVSSIIGLGCFTVYVIIYTTLKGQKRNIAFPAGPFLAVGSAAAYFMKIGGCIL